MWFFELVTQMQIDKKRELDHPIHYPNAWTVFACVDPGHEAEQAMEWWTWRKVAQVFGAAIGVSFRCSSRETGQWSDEGAAIDAGERFLKEVVPYRPWLVLIDDEKSMGAKAVWDHIASSLVGRSPVGLGRTIAASEISQRPDGYLEVGDCSRARWAEPRTEACLWRIRHEELQGRQEILLRDEIKALLPSDQDGIRDAPTPPWSVFVFSLVLHFDVSSDREGSARKATRLLTTQILEAVEAKARQRSVAEVVQISNIRSSLDLYGLVDASTTYEEFMTLRQRLDAVDLRNFEDKIRLRRNLLQPLGVLHTPTFYMSNEDPNILEHIVALESYVVKPTHMTESEHVAVVHRGHHIFDVQLNGEVVRQAGELADPNLLQKRVLDAWNRTAYEWECKAVVSATPGVIVESLVLAKLDPGWPEKERVEEVRCHVIWGEALAVEWSVGRKGSSVFVTDIDDKGRKSFSTVSHWISQMEDLSILDPDGWVETVMMKCIPMAQLQAQRVASAVGADHLRVDFLVEGNCDQIYVSEVELFPAVPFHAKVMEVIEKRWRYGYGYDSGAGF
mmetsp:Transcript_18341/g.59568  ORF Transcript_18341/g.59568 Transcript_18341/m.59568 type:complete len:562 (+) Transcript_18341:1039-2724(+)